jgi:hypothetical protein
MAIIDLILIVGMPISKHPTVKIIFSDFHHVTHIDTTQVSCYPAPNSTEIEIAIFKFPELHRAQCEDFFFDLPTCERKLFHCFPH